MQGDCIIPSGILSGRPRGFEKHLPPDLKKSLVEGQKRGLLFLLEKGDLDARGKMTTTTKRQGEVSLVNLEQRVATSPRRGLDTCYSREKEKKVLDQNH